MNHDKTHIDYSKRQISDSGLLKIEKKTHTHTDQSANFTQICMHFAKCLSVAILYSANFRDIRTSQEVDGNFPETSRLKNKIKIPPRPKS